MTRTRTFFIFYLRFNSFLSGISWTHYFLYILPRLSRPFLERAFQLEDKKGDVEGKAKDKALGKKAGRGDGEVNEEESVAIAQHLFGELAVIAGPLLTAPLGSIGNQAQADVKVRCRDNQPPFSRP